MVESLKPRANFVEQRAGLSAETAARRLLQIIQRTDIDVGQYAYTGVTNSTFTREGGTVFEYAAGVAHGTDCGWFEIDRSGMRIVLLQAGRDL